MNTFGATVPDDLHDPAVLEPPLQRVRDGQVADVGPVLEDAFRKGSTPDLFQRQVSFFKECGDVVLVCVVVQEFADAARGLEVRRVLPFDVGGAHKVEERSVILVRLVVHQHNEVVAQAVHLLARVAKWTRGLRLRDRGHLEINPQRRVVDPAGRVAGVVGEPLGEMVYKKVLDIGTYCLAVALAVQLGDGPAFEGLYEVGDAVFQRR